MTRPGPTADRLDELLAGAAPASDEEVALLALTTRLRSLDDEPASAALRERVAVIAQGPADRPDPGAAGLLARAREALRFGDGPRRPALVAASILALLIAAAITVPVVTGGSQDDDTASAPGVAGSQVDDGSAGSVFAPDTPGAAAGGAAESGEAAADSAQRSAAATAGQPVPGGVVPPSPDPGRPQEVIASTRVKVDDVDALSGASAEAMRAARDLGGFTVSSRFSVPSGEEGSADLVLRVPTDRVEQALTAFAGLGTVISQDATLTDLGEQVDLTERRIVTLRSRLAAARAELAKAPDDAGLQARVDAFERALSRRVAEQRGLERRAELARIDLTLTTVGPEAPESDNRFVVAFQRSWDNFATVLEWLIAAAVFLVPIALIALVAGWLSREGRRRQDARALGRP